MPTLHTSTLSSLPLLSKGKVRDIYAVGDDKLLIITTDRLSAFDVVMHEPIPQKGQVLNQMSNFWFKRLEPILPNHLTDIAPETVVAHNETEQVRGRAVVAKRLHPIPIEVVVRAYLIGSAWRDYQTTGAVCGIKLPPGLQLAARLEEPIFTPTTKAKLGEHDVQISFADMEQCIGSDLACRIRDTGIQLYQTAADYAATRGMIIADTKFEFGLDDHGVLHLMDEVLTPDSSRFWSADSYQLGIAPPSFDKQFVRDYLETLGWNKMPPAPALPAAIIAKTSDKYCEALERLTGISLSQQEPQRTP